MPKIVNENRQEEKKNQSIARVTTSLKGVTKNMFFEELRRTGGREGRLACEIITMHYKNKTSLSVLHHKMKCE